MRSLKKLALLGALALVNVPASAAMIHTPQLLNEAQQTQSTNPHERVRLEQRLLERGVEPDAAAARVQRMTDSEIAALHSQLDELPAGQGISTTNLLLIIIILILLL